MAETKEDEITDAMIEAGLDILFEADLTAPIRSELRKTIRDVYLEMTAISLGRRVFRMHSIVSEDFPASQRTGIPHPRFSSEGWRNLTLLHEQRFEIPRDASALYVLSSSGDTLVVTDDPDMGTHAAMSSI